MADKINRLRPNSIAAESVPTKSDASLSAANLHPAVAVAPLVQSVAQRNTVIFSSADIDRFTEAARSGTLKEVTDFLISGMPVNATSTPMVPCALVNAARKNRPLIVTVLMAFGADFDPEVVETAISAAVNVGLYDIVLLIVEQMKANRASVTSEPRLTPS